MSHLTKYPYLNPSRLGTNWEGRIFQALDFLRLRKFKSSIKWKSIRLKEV